MLTPPPVDPERLCEEKGARIPNRSVSNTKLYKLACLQVGEEKNVAVLDTWKLFLGDKECTPENTRDFLNDGLHLDVKGNMKISEGIISSIKSLWPEIMPNELEAPVIWHDKVDPKKLTLCNRPF